MNRKIIHALFRLFDAGCRGTLPTSVPPRGRQPFRAPGRSAPCRWAPDCCARIHSRVAWMFLPVERSITVSAPHLVAQRIFSTSSSMELATAELPMLALIFTRKLRPMIIGSKFRVVDVGGDDRPAARHLLPYELRRDHTGSPRQRLRRDAAGSRRCAPQPCFRRLRRRPSRPRFSRMAIYSISGVMTPCLAYQSCVTGCSWLARNGCRAQPGKLFQPPASLRGAVRGVVPRGHGSGSHCPAAEHSGPRKIPRRRAR